MPKKAKISIEEKISAVESYLRGELSQRQAAQKAGVKIAPFQRWLRIYRVEGPEGLLPHTTGRKYSSNQKLEAVKAYLSGEGSIGEVCAKRGIWSDAQFGDWIKEYNAHGDFSSKKKSGGGSCMRQGRETTRWCSESEPFKATRISSMRFRVCVFRHLSRASREISPYSMR